MTYYLLLLICLISLFSIKVQKSIMTFNQRTIKEKFITTNLINIFMIKYYINSIFSYE